MSKLSELGQSVMGLFSPAGGAIMTPATPVGQPPSSTSGIVPTGQDTPPPLPTDPQQLQQAGKGDQSPMAEFAKLWDTPVVDPKAPPIVTASDLVRVDPAKLAAIAKQLDFTKGLDPALLAKAQEGDAAAFMAVMNHTTQASFMQAVHAMGTVASNALTKQREELLADMPSQIRAATLSNSLAAESPLFTNPAAKPVVESIQAAILAKFPEASAQELQQHTLKYFQEMAKLVQPKPVATKSSAAGKELQDWGGFFDQN